MGVLRGVCCGTLALVVVACGALYAYYEMLIPPTAADEVRLRIEKYIHEALETGEWDKVNQHFDLWNAGLIIGNANGVQFNTQRGWIGLETEYSIASASKLVCSLTVYRLMGKSNGRLTPESLVSDFLHFWPKSPAPGGNVALKHLLAFTTGFNMSSSDELAPRTGCYNSKLSLSWEQCLHNIAVNSFPIPPGTEFWYNSFHLIVAAAMAQVAVGKPLTTEAWIDSVRTEVFVPSGIEETPVYAPFNEDVPPFIPKYGSNTIDRTGVGFPDFAGGMRMSGKQYRKMLQALQFGNLLSLQRFTELTTDHTKQVTKWDGLASMKTSLNTGTWHYAQGCWVTCDAANRAMLTQNLAPMTAEELYCHNGGDPLPHIVHSVGMWGLYGWMDLTHGYYGVMVLSLGTCLTRALQTTAFASVVVCAFVCYVCGACGEVLQPKDAVHYKAQSMEYQGFQLQQSAPFAGYPPEPEDQGKWCCA